MRKAPRNVDMSKRGVYESSVPPFVVTPSEDYPNWSIVTCGREDCGATHLVKTRAWKRAPYVCRPCPYCFKVGRIPGKVLRGPGHRNVELRSAGAA